jgi:hypothetical protein
MFLAVMEDVPPSLPAEEFPALSETVASAVPAVTSKSPA